MTSAIVVDVIVRLALCDEAVQHPEFAGPTPKVLPQQVGRDSVQPGQRHREIRVVAETGLERSEKYVSQQVARIVRTDPPREIPEDRLGVPVEDLAEPSGFVQRFDYEFSIRPADHISFLPSSPTSVRGIVPGHPT